MTIKKPKQKELFKAETTWFHVFKSMIDSGDLAAMTGSELKVYLVVKSFTNFSTGRSFPAIETIAQNSGLSPSQVTRALRKLETNDYIKIQKKGRKNCYTLREKVNCTDDDGRPSAVATWDYIPHGVTDAQAELKNFLSSGVDGKIINIERLTLNVFNDKSTQINFDNLSKTELLAELKKSLKGTAT